MSLISLPYRGEFAMTKNKATGVTSTNVASNCNPCLYQEEQPLNLHMIRASIAQVAVA